MKKLGLSMIAGIVIVVAAAVMSPAGAIDYPPTTAVADASAQVDSQAQTGTDVAQQAEPTTRTGLGFTPPNTGTDTAPLLWLGGGLIAVGAVLATRHRRRAARS